MHQTFDSSLVKIRYRKEKTEFYRELSGRVQDYFRKNKISKYADAGMHRKTALLFSCWISAYALLLSNRFDGGVLILLQVVFHYSMFLMTIGIAHDGSHHAYSRNETVNRWMNYVFDLVGINTYLWELNHVKSHHRAPNIPLYDSAIDSFLLFRFHPRAPRLWFHRFQHGYIFFIYSCATLFKLFFLDFFSFRRRRIGMENIERHPRKERCFFLLTRAVVIAYTVVIPFWLIEAPWPQLLTGFLLGHFLSGISLGIIFQTTHLTDRTAWPEPDSTGYLDETFDRHILKTTADFAPRNFFVTWISGGLNHHVAHHLFPSICHTHLPVITEMVREAAEKYGYDYHAYRTVGDAIVSHLRALKKLGAPSGERAALPVMLPPAS
jgi:linoleoyl-CoA desaturase